MWNLDTYFDLYNSTQSLKWLEWDRISVCDFYGSAVDGVLKKVSWDNIKVDIEGKWEVTIHLVEEWRDSYPVNYIVNNKWEEVYCHIDPEFKQVRYIPLDIDQIISDQEAYYQRLEQQIIQKKN